MQSSNVAGIKSLPRFRFSDALFETSPKKADRRLKEGVATVRFRKVGNKAIVGQVPFVL